jgi:hypothetical protein
MTNDLESIHGTAGTRRSALYYGPFGYIAPLIAGFVLGGVAFLIGDAMVTTHNTYAELPVLLAACGGGAALMLIGALVANWVIGSRIREQVELQRATFAGDQLPEMQPRPDVPGIMLEPASAYAAARSAKAKAHQN